MHIRKRVNWSNSAMLQHDTKDLFPSVQSLYAVQSIDCFGRCFREVETMLAKHPQYQQCYNNSY